MLLGARQFFYAGSSSANTFQFARGQYARATIPMNGLNAFSFGAWMRVDSDGASAAFYGLNWPESSGYGWTILCMSPSFGHSKAWVGSRSGSTRISDGASGALGEWHHLYAVFAGTSLTFYFDGIANKQNTFGGRSTAANGNNFYVGLNPNDFTVADSQIFSTVGISIFRRALSANEVMAAYSNIFVDPNLPPYNDGLIAGYNCIDGSGMAMANVVAGGPALEISGQAENWTIPIPNL